jgi:hypothetical protein
MDGEEPVLPQLTNFVTLAFFAHGHALAAHPVLFAQAALCHRAGLGFLAERFDAARGAPEEGGAQHHVAASAALLESVLLGLFGIEASAAERRVALRPTLPPHWDEARLSNVRVGETTLDLRLYRRREPGVTVLGLELERGEGPALQLGFAPVLPPLSRLLDGPGWLRPSGAVVPRRLHRSQGETLTLEARVLEGPMVLLPSVGEGVVVGPDVRVVAQRLEKDTLHWSFAGPPGTSMALPFFSDFEVVVSGARLADGELVLEFPADPRGVCEVEVRAR